MFNRQVCDLVEASFAVLKMNLTILLVWEVF